MEALVHNGADASIRDIRGRTAVHMAATCGHVSPLGTLLMQVCNLSKNFPEVLL